jgi:hypothetical protein
MGGSIVTTSAWPVPGALIASSSAAETAATMNEIGARPAAARRARLRGA